MLSNQLSQDIKRIFSIKIFLYFFNLLKKCKYSKNNSLTRKNKVRNDAQLCGPSII
jgi:hypothetical protein